MKDQPNYLRPLIPFLDKTLTSNGIYILASENPQTHLVDVWAV